MALHKSLALLKASASAIVAANTPDLTARQLCILLECYDSEEAQTVRGLSARFGVPKPSITRALDKLEALNFALRVSDPRDKRSVLVKRTSTGFHYLTKLEARAEQGA